MILQTCCAGCDEPGSALCTTCRFALLTTPPDPGPDGVVAALPYTGRTRQVLLGLKYRNRRRAARHVAGLLVNRLIARSAHHDLDAVTWAPTSAARRRWRGFDQGEEIARTVARQLGVPCRRMLARAEVAGAQTGRSRAERLEGPVFRARPVRDGARVLVVDDVVTTGATLRSAAAALRSQGAGEVVLAAVAKTPEPAGATVIPIRRDRISPAA